MGTLGTKGREVGDRGQQLSRRRTRGGGQALVLRWRGFHEPRPLLVKAKALGVGAPAPRQLLGAPRVRAGPWRRSRRAAATRKAGLLLGAQPFALAGACSLSGRAGFAAQRGLSLLSSEPELHITRVLAPRTPRRLAPHPSAGPGSPCCATWRKGSQSPPNTPPRLFVGSVTQGQGAHPPPGWGRSNSAAPGEKPRIPPRGPAPSAGA